MEKKKYHFIVHPDNEGVQLACDDGILLLFSTEKLAQQRRDKWGSGNLRNLDLEGLAEKFSPCCRVILDPSENPTAAEAINICDLS